MKKGWLVAGALSLLMAACQQQPRPANEIAESFVDLQAYFADPHDTFRSAPFWVWDGTVTKAWIDESLKDLKAHGFGGVFVHPRYGMTTEYLSEEWFELFEYTVQEAKKLGMDVWIYDENSYPSGFAGGHVPAQMPESYNEGVSLQEVALTELKEEQAEKLMALFVKEGEQYKDVTTEIKAYIGKKGDFLGYEKAFYEFGRSWHAGFCYVDLLKPGVTEKFIDVTFTQGYDKYSGKEYGKTIKGTFTDEPNIAPAGHGNFRWTPDLFDRFEERYGYRLQEHLPCIKHDVGDYKRTRHNYYQLMLQLFIDRFSRPFYEWCASKNLEFTGHYWEHGWPAPHHGGDNMAMYAWHQRPAIDLLFNTIDSDVRTDQFGNVRNVKELSSVANQMGNRRTLSETYGGAGWELTLDDMKRLGDWEYVLGVNTLNQHLSLQTLLGCRKHDYPQSFTYHTPYWDQYTALNLYFARLSYALSAGHQINDILIVEPTTTAWMYYLPENWEGGKSIMNDIDSTFRQLLDGLERQQVEYDLASENILKDQGTVKEGRYVVNQRAYQTVILPEYSESIDQATYDQLTQFLGQGGRVVAIGALPTRINGVEAPLSDEWKKVELAPNTAAALLLFTCTAMEWNNLQPGDGRFYHMRRVLDDGELIFFANSSKEAKATATITMSGAGVVEMDALSGNIQGYPATVAGGKVTYDISIEPSGSLLLFVSKSALKGYEVKTVCNGGSAVAPLGDIQVVPLQTNVMTIDYTTLSFDGKTLPTMAATDATNELFKARGYAGGNVWFSAMQYKKTILEQDTFKAGSGFKASYLIQIGEAFDYSSIKAVLEQQYEATITINGQPISPIAGEWWLDKAFKVFAIGQYLKQGDNILTIDAPKMSIFAELEAIYIIGNFNVNPADKGFILAAAKPLALGSWQLQGWPFYSHSVAYTQTFNVPEVKRCYSVELDQWKGTVAEIWVNGQCAGIIGWRPYTLCVGQYIRQGDNTIEVRIIGSLRNQMGPFHATQPAPGIVTPWSFRYQPIPWPAGKAYQFFDYGLMTPFRLVSQ